ncbi:MAG: ABC transporter permease [Burkholderiales bacterium]|nr:ABC transporter permease [Burkholderiales bacterium]
MRVARWRTCARRAAVATGLGLIGVVACAQPATPPGWICGSFSRSDRLPPEDYRKPSPRLKVVENFHFGPNVEALVRPMQRGMALGSDLDFTLWGYPNHHRALAALIRLAAREKTDQPAGASFTVDCYFERAFMIAPDDVVARMLYASYLGGGRRQPEALAQLKMVVDQAGDNPLTHFNAGLVYVEIGAYEEAAAQARRAAELGYPRDTLVQELQRRGKWQGPPLSASVAASSASAPLPGPASAPPPAGPADRASR